MNRGTYVGVMLPDPRPVVFEHSCLSCYEPMRDITLGEPGYNCTVTIRCAKCGERYAVTVKPKELDS